MNMLIFVAWAIDRVLFLYCSVKCKSLDCIRISFSSGICKTRPHDLIISVKNRLACGERHDLNKVHAVVLMPIETGTGNGAVSQKI